MSLKEYKRKRDFQQNARAQRRQNQDRARACNTSFRSTPPADCTTISGSSTTARSKAGPCLKGPASIPSVKSLAVQVEDHPIEYATFEGVIPQGEYGGGTVMVWDHGTWEPEVDPDEGFKTGKLKFRLHGEKLHGSWALVRMGGRAGDGGKNWLLIKHRDDEAKPLAKFDILKREAASVVSGRDLDEIASDADAVWTSNGKAAKKSKTKATQRRRPRLRLKLPKRPLKKNGKSRVPIGSQRARKSSRRVKNSVPKGFQAAARHVSQPRARRATTGCTS